MQPTDTLSAQPTPAPEEENWLKRTVRLSGFSFLIGDAALIGGGVVRALGKGGKKEELGNALTGLLWAQAGVASSLYGDPKKPMQLRIHAHNLEEYLNKQGIPIPDEVKQRNELLKDKGPGERIERFISKHPTEVFNSIIGAASIGMVFSGAKAIARKDKVAANSLWAGLLVMGGAAAGLLIKEDPNAPEKAKGGGFFDKAAAFIKEQPLRLTSTLYLLNDYFIFNKAWGEYTHEFKASGGKDWRFLWPSIAAVANLVGNGLLFMSSRNQLKDGFSETHVAQMEELAADAVLAQPVAERQGVADTIARYLRAQKISERSPEQLRSEILERAQQRAGITAQPQGNFSERVRASQDAASETVLS